MARGSAVHQSPFLGDGKGFYSMIGLRLRVYQGFVDDPICHRGHRFGETHYEDAIYDVSNVTPGVHLNAVAIDTRLSDLQG